VGAEWLHEIKHDGFRVIARKDGTRVKLAAVIAEHGTEMVLGCGAVLGPDGSLDIGFASYAPALQRMIGPFGPARVTTTGMARPAGVTDEAWRELRTTAGIVIRALLLDEVGNLS